MIQQLAEMQPTDLERVVTRSAEAPPAARDNVQAALVRARFIRLDEAWAKAAARGNLEQALSLVSMTADNPPQIDLSARLDSLAEAAGSRLSGDRAYDAGLGALQHALRGLRGNTADYYAPENSYLAHVLTSGRGNPITLCSVAILVGRRLELPVWGINSPGHFLGFYGDLDLRVGSYFDPFEGFQRLNSGEVQSLLARFVEHFDQAMLQPASDREIIARSLRNLAGGYMRLGRPEQARNLERWNRLIRA